MQKVLILGGTGMAGHVVTSYLTNQNDYQVYNICYQNPFNEQSIIMDVFNESLLKNTLNDIKPDIVINCIGKLISASKKSPTEAIYINSYFPHRLADLGVELEFKLIHISTDCVFSGKKGGYVETDLTDGEDVYAKSKALGEIINARDLTIRTSIIGPELKNTGEGLFDWFMKQHGEINGYSNVFWGGVTTLQLAKVIDVFIKQQTVGLVHLTNNLKISKYHLLEIFKECFGKKDLVIHHDATKHYDKSLINTRKDIDVNVPGYQQMIAEMKLFMEANNSNGIYSKYIKQ